MNIESSILESITNAFIALDRDWKFTYINKQAEPLLERKRKDLIGKNIWKEFPQAIGSTFYKQYKIAIKTNKSVHFEEFYPPLSRWFQVSAYPSKNGISVYFNDVSKRKKIEEKLKASELKYRSLTQSAKDAIISADDKGKIISWNNAAFKIFGYNEKEVLNKPLTILMPDIYKDAHRKGIERVRTTGKTKIVGKTVDLSGLRKDGTEFPLELSLAKWKIKEKVFYTGTVRDITERKLLQQKKDEFLAMASHELKTPITVIKVYAQILKKRLGFSEDNKDIYFLSQIESQTSKITTLINDLLEVTKIEAGKLAFSKKKFDLNVLIKKIVVDFQYVSDTHQIIKVGEVEKNVMGDEDRIGQVLINLLTNAIKYSPNADKIIVKVKENKKNITVGVQDFGMGISKDKQEQIFGRYFRVNKKEEETIKGSGFKSSSGLGLYISAEIIVRHGGKIWVESKKEKDLPAGKQGSTFYFTLPLDK